jgi:phage FluMu protein Com
MIQRAVKDIHRVDNSEDVRCNCGQLVARWVDGDIEIKCKRCRRLVRIAVPRSRASSSAKS